MLIFGLHSTSDDQLSNPSNKSCTKCKKMANIFMAKLTRPKIDTTRNEKVGNLAKFFNGRFGMTKIQCTFPLPMEMKSWKSGKKFLWQIWHDQNSMYPPPLEGCGWTRMEHEYEQATDGTCMGDRMIWVDFIPMAYYTADSCAISPSA